jgi:hypothetical protein
MTEMILEKKLTKAVAAAAKIMFTKTKTYLAFVHVFHFLVYHLTMYRERSPMDICLITRVA